MQLFRWAGKNLLVVLVVVGALLDVGVFAFQLEQYGQIQNNSAKSECWSTVLDRIVSHRPPAILPSDIVKAQACERVP